MNIVETEIAAVKEAASAQAENALKELQQAQLAFAGGLTGETVLL